MSAAEYRHPLSDEQKRLSDAALTATLGPGEGLSVKRFPPFWDVLAIRDGRRAVYIVTDSSRPNRKPLKVYGPAGRSEAEQWAENTAAMWRMTHVSHIDDEPLGQFRGNR